MTAPLLTELEAATALGVSVKELRALEDGPVRVRVGRQLIRYERSEVERAGGRLPAYEPPPRRPRRARPPMWTEAAIIAALRRWATTHGRSPRSTDWKGRAHDRPTASTVSKSFGTWANGLLAAGLPLPARLDADVTASLTSAQAEALRALAARRSMSVSALVRRVVVRELREAAAA